MFQELSGDPKPEHKWPSEDDQEQVGHRNKVKRRYSFDMSFVFEIHFSSLLVVLINAFLRFT